MTEDAKTKAMRINLLKYSKCEPEKILPAKESCVKDNHAVMILLNHVEDVCKNERDAVLKEAEEVALKIINPHSIDADRMREQFKNLCGKD